MFTYFVTRYPFSRAVIFPMPRGYVFIVAKFTADCGTAVSCPMLCSQTLKTKVFLLNILSQADSGEIAQFRAISSSVLGRSAFSTFRTFFGRCLVYDPWRWTIASPFGVQSLRQWVAKNSSLCGDEFRELSQ